MSAKNVKRTSETKTKSLIMSSPLSAPAAAINRWASLQQDSIARLKDGKSSVEIAIDGSPRAKTAFGEAAAKEYQAKAAKLRPSLLPVEATVEGAKAMEFGAKKYGVDQWRTVDMQPREFMDALERHLIALKQGEKVAPDSGVSHLGHIIANCAILLARFERLSDRKTEETK